MTSLNIGQVLPDRRASLASAECPSCGAKKERRVDGGGFGPKKLTLCGECGHEFKEGE